MRSTSCITLAAALLLAAGASAGPNLPADDPDWDRFRDALAKGQRPDPMGGVQTVSEGAEYGTLLPEGPWFLPAQRLSLRLAGAAEHDRPYSLPVRPRDIAGGIALSCEYQEGRPCGDGVGTALELDSSAGLGSLLTAATRLRAAAGTANFSNELVVDRAYLKFEYGPFAVQVGRDALALGPSVRSALMVSTHAVPQDGIRLQLHPVALPFAPALRFSLFYFLDRLRDPQHFPGTLLDCTRAQIDIADRVQLGGSRLLMLGGEGAPDYGGFSGFILEHFGRTKEGVGTAENNRLSFDLAVRVPEWSGARFYYEIAFEDTRSQFLNSLQYDADHLLGVEIRNLRWGPLRRLFLEVEHTGWVSQEHWLFTTGMTNRGRTLGDAMGPDGTSVWARADIMAGKLTISPWFEWLRFVSDLYDSSGPEGVVVVAKGPIEHRQRLGADLRAALSEALWFSLRVFGERIGNADFLEGNTRFSGGATASATFHL
jgi:capsule assembly protein Wzi